MAAQTSVIKRLLLVIVLLTGILAAALLIALSSGSSREGMGASLAIIFGQEDANATLETIIWHLRLPRVLLAVLVGATLSLGGLVFQALLRNPLAEPYILGISGGSAIGAIIGIMLGLSRFPGVTFCAFKMRCCSPGSW
jgi:iron complex transport system permease protein